MKTHVLRILPFILLGFLLVSCGNQGTLQSHPTGDRPISEFAPPPTEMSAGQSSDTFAGGNPPSEVVTAAEKLGIDPRSLHRSLGPPPPDIDGAARLLEVSEEALRDALGRPTRARDLEQAGYLTLDAARKVEALLEAWRMLRKG